MLGAPVAGSRTWMWQMAAPAFAASRQALAICCGVIGRAGWALGEVILPVTAQVMMTFRDMFPPAFYGTRCLRRSGRARKVAHVHTGYVPAALRASGAAI